MRSMQSVVAPTATACSVLARRRQGKTRQAHGPGLVLSIHEKKYGRPAEHCLGLVAGLTGMKHMEMVAWLKSEHGLGHDLAAIREAAPDPVLDPGIVAGWPSVSCSHSTTCSISWRLRPMLARQMMIGRFAPVPRISLMSPIRLRCESTGSTDSAMTSAPSLADWSPNAGRTSGKPRRSAGSNRYFPPRLAKTRSIIGLKNDSGRLSYPGSNEHWS